MKKSELVKEYYLKQLKDKSHKLPSIQTCHVDLGISKSLISKVINDLLSQNLIKSVQGKGLYSKDYQFTNTNDKSMRNSFENYLDEFENYLLKDIPNNSALPSLKELGLLFNLDYRTIKKIITHPQILSNLENKGRQFYKRNKALIKNNGLIIWVAFSHENRLKLMTDREREFHQWLFHFSSLFNVELEIVLINDRLKKEINFNEINQKIKETANKRVVLGLISTLWHFKDPFSLLGVLKKFSLPLCVWHETPHEIPKQKHSKSLSLFDISYGCEHGRVVGEYLVKKRPKEILYFSPFHLGKWSQDRLEGLKEISHANKVEYSSFCIDLYTSEWDISLDRPELIFDPKQKYFDWQNAKFALELQQIEFARDQQLYTIMEPLFIKALNHGKLKENAWVFANDKVAALAYEFFKRKSISPQNWPILVGFDNSMLSYELGLNSYQFNTEDMALKMIQKICHTDYEIHFEKITLKGKVIEKTPLPF